MKIRPLKLNDAELMLEWMKDKELTKYMQTDFNGKNLSDALNFIISSNNQDYNTEINLAITDEFDEYLGTVSLKNIDKKFHYAEFAIVIRNKAIGKGVGWFGMKEIFNKAFYELRLKTIYWCVSKSNLRAVKFYQKHNFTESFIIPLNLIEKYRNLNDILWFSVSSDKFND
jgi:RimJ/RimL family protein N-acetyltransferase